MPPRVRTNTLTGWSTLARSSGLDPDELLRRAGLDPADLDVPDRWVPAAPVTRLLERSAELSAQPDFALRLAEARTLGTLGPLAVVLREEPDLRSAVDLLVRYQRAYNEALHLTLREDGDQAMIEGWLEFGEPAPCDQALDLVMAALVGIVRALVGPAWRPRSARFARPPPADPEPWHRLFGPAVVFGDVCTALVVRSADLDAPVVASDPSLRPYTRQFLTSVVAPRTSGSTSYPADVEEVLEVLLPLGRQSLARTARSLGLHPSGLQRYLAEQGQSFTTFLDTTRARLAERHLANRRHSLTEVSRLLGFSAPSAFSRWFRHRFGTTPSAWRRAVHERPPVEPRLPSPRGGDEGIPTVRSG